MPYFFPEEETLDRAGLDRLQRERFAAMLEEVLKTNAFYAKKYRGSSFNGSKDGLAELPLTTRDEIQRDQVDNRPYGTNLTYPIDRYCRLHQTSGSSGQPLRCLDREVDWDWWKACWGVIYRAAGVEDSDRFMFPFSFGPFIGFWAAFESAVALGNLCLPAGGMTTTARLRFMLDNDVTFVGCTPTYALRMAEVAGEQGLDLAHSKVRGLIIAGEPGGSIPSTRGRIESAWGARVFDHPGMTEMGPYGFECVESPGGVHINETAFIPEVIHQETGRPVPDGESGELVLTNLGRWGSPLIRYRTGDCVRLTRRRCDCGRWFARMEGGILGRIDQMLIIRGNNVYPAAIEGILREFAEVAEFRLTVDQSSALADLMIEIEPSAGVESGGLPGRIESAIRDRLHFKPTVRAVAPGTLPRFEMKARRLVRKDAE
ncbi:MAG: phenylacetate--CoA ligase family protein [Planctomycetota bacterium]|nr:phenylacetate--CoA ligase family protein [Planctomycetota bacterium]